MSTNILKQIAKFDGTTNTNFKRYLTELLAIGALQGVFNLALTSNLDISTTFTGTHTQAIQQENTKKRTTTWSYLLLTLEDAPQLLVEQMTSLNPFDAWT